MREPEYAVSASFDVPVEARDGTRLATDVYRPAHPDTHEPVDEPLPALLERTPYDKRGRLSRHGEWFAERGYVVAIQDCRGRYASEGRFRLLVDDPEDGADTVEWLAGRPYCDGQVGTIGTSYGAWTQTALAALDPDGLSAMFVNQGGANGWESAVRHHGALELRWLAWALTVGAGFSDRARADPAIEGVFADVDVGRLFERGARPGRTPLRHAPAYEEAFFEVASADRASGPFESPGLNFAGAYDAAADVPTVWSTGWYDSYTRAVCRNFTAMAERKASDQFLLVGPWTHGWDRYPLPAWSTPAAGDLAFGDDAVRDYQVTRLEFFDHYLKGRESWDRPRVEYFGMGGGDGSERGGRRYHGGVWRSADTWPPSATEPRTYYAHADGSLRRSEPPADGGRTTYQFDPADPVPTLGGNCSSYLRFEEREESVHEYPLDARETVSLVTPGGVHQATDPDTFGASAPYGPLEEREDVLVFRTPPLDAPVEVTGPVSVTVYGSTDGPDTDFTAKLIDEAPPSPDFPAGFAANLTDSICRARYRGFREEPDPVEPGEVYPFRLELYPTANTFRAGHRIRLDLSSSNFPRFDVNPNTGESYGARTTRVARNAVYHEAAHPTGLELRVVRGDD